MTYMGSKRRIAKYILPIMLAERKPNQYWVEPFVGGGNLIDKVEGNRLGADINRHLINALLAIRDCVADLPKNNNEFTETNYKDLRKNDDFIYKGYAGFAFSFGGKWLGGWRRDATARDYVREAYDNALKQNPKLQDVVLVQSSYLDLTIPSDSIIYCDPPYNGATKYQSEFSHEIFWQWCRDQSKKGHVTFISEYNAPDDFECIWSKPIVNDLNKNATNSKRTLKVEKLFRYKPPELLEEGSIR